MASLVGPITLRAAPLVRHCCSDALVGLTPMLVIRDGVDQPQDASSPWDGYTVWSTSGTGTDEVSGEIRFGICCAQSITMQLSGNLRGQVSAGHDTIEVYLNDVLVWSAASDPDAAYIWTDYNDDTVLNNSPPAAPGGNYYSYYYYEGTPGTGNYQEYHELTIPLPDNACGNVIKILGGTGSVDPVTPESAGIGWEFIVTALPPIA